jgi:uncharacterized protein
MPVDSPSKHTVRLSQGSRSSANAAELVNRTRSTQLATRLEVADTPATRSKGLLGRIGLAPGEGLWIVPCESVHTFWMKFSLDLVYLDRGLRVKKIRSAVPPWRVSGCLTAHSVLELPAGTIIDSQTQVGDILEVIELPAEERAAH